MLATKAAQLQAKFRQKFDSQKTPGGLLASGITHQNKISQGGILSVIITHDGPQTSMHVTIWRCYLLSYMGKWSIDYYTQPGAILTTVPRPLIVGASVPYTAVRWPTGFVSIPGEAGGYDFGDVRASVSVKETFRDRFEPESSTTSNVKLLPTELYIGVKYRSITQPRVFFMASPYIRSPRLVLITAICSPCKQTYAFPGHSINGCTASRFRGVSVVVSPCHMQPLSCFVLRSEDCARKTVFSILFYFQ